jgi:hypothetical protein
MKTHLKDILYTHGESLVFLGAGGPAEEWVNGVHDLLFAEGITTERDPVKFWKYQEKIDFVSRSDLILTFPDDVDLGKLAIWRLRFGDTMWLSDYIDNGVYVA